MKNEAKKIKQVIESIADIAAKERREEPDYQRLLNAKTIGDVIQEAELMMTGVALDVTDILKTRFGLKIDNDRFWYLMGLSEHLGKLEDHIEKTEGRVCCVDKAYSRAISYIKGGEMPKES